MGMYVRRLVPALAGLPECPPLIAALDASAGQDPWPQLTSIERLWAKGRNPFLWEQDILPKLARRFDAGLLHCTANVAPWRSPVPVVVTVHDVIFLRAPWDMADHISPRQWAAYFYYRFGVRPGARRAGLVLTDSEYSRGQLLARLHLPPGKVRTVPLAEPFEVRPLGENELPQMLSSLGVEKPYLLGLGAIDRRKNTANLVRAFARLPRAAAGTLVLAGFEKLGHSRIPELVASLGLSRRVRIFDYLPVEQLTALFQGASAFIYPTRAEGFGLPILQAFHLGVPVVTSGIASVREVAGDAARFADPLDPVGLSREIMAILVDPSESHRLAYAGYLQSKRFNWEITARRTLAAYRSVLGQVADSAPAAAGNAPE